MVVEIKRSITCKVSPQIFDICLNVGKSVLLPLEAHDKTVINFFLTINPEVVLSRRYSAYHAKYTVWDTVKAIKPN